MPRRLAAMMFTGLAGFTTMASPSSTALTNGEGPTPA
jgi:hypothetical protein